MAIASAASGMELPNARDEPHTPAPVGITIRSEQGVEIVRLV